VKLKDLEMEIEHLITENRPDFEISKKIKSVIKSYQSSIEDSFDNSTGKGKAFLLKHTRFYDSIISLIYKTILRRIFHNYLPMRNSIPIVIVALGSYGREELTIYSDIDLMIAFREIEGYNIEAIIEKFLYMVWDSGLKLGHRVHNINELQSVAKEDITIKTALLESRMVIGSSFVWNIVGSELNRVRTTDIKKYILEREADRESRYKKYLSYSMQPDIKDGYGGLRDANMLFWILNLIYRVNDIRELSGTLFSEDEYRKFFLATDFIQQVRTVSHLIAKKKKDKIEFSDIPDILNRLSISSQFTFVSKLLDSMWTINRFSNLVLRKVIKKFLYEPNRVPLLRAGRVLKGVYILDDRLYLSDKLNIQNFNQLLKLLNSLPDRELEINNTIYSTVENIDLNSRVSYKYVLQLFKREFPFTPIQILFRTGLLHHIIPLFAKIRFLPQFDGYHSHSVDIHSLYTLKALQEIENSQILELYKTLNRKESLIMRLVTFFHDIGKGRTGDHSEVGAKLWRGYAKELSVDDEVLEIVAHLIKIHTLMTRVAYREDLYNERVIYSFVAKVGNRRTLDLLYILTYADIRGVYNGKVSSHSEKLLKTLYSRASTAYQNGELIKESERRVKVEKQIERNQKFKDLPRTLQRKILSISSNFLFLKYSATEILDMAIEIRGIENYRYFIDRSESGREPFSIRVYRKDNFDIAFFLNSLTMLSVVSLDIFEIFNGVKYFRIGFADPIENDDIPYIEQLLESSLSKESREYKPIKPNIKRENIDIECNYSEDYFKISLNAMDQKGLLAYILKVFEDEEINVTSSKIHTFKKRVRDMFLVERGSRNCEKIEPLKDKILNYHSI